jgi:hypothetical protein
MLRIQGRLVESAKDHSHLKFIPAPPRLQSNYRSSHGFSAGAGQGEVPTFILTLSNCFIEIELMRLDNLLASAFKEKGSQSVKSAPEEPSAKPLGNLSIDLHTNHCNLWTTQSMPEMLHGHRDVCMELLPEMHHHAPFFQHGLTFFRRVCAAKRCSSGRFSSRPCTKLRTEAATSQALFSR